MAEDAAASSRRRLDTKHLLITAASSLLFIGIIVATLDAKSRQPSVLLQSAWSRLPTKPQGTRGSSPIRANDVAKTPISYRLRGAVEPSMENGAISADARRLQENLRKYHERVKGTENEWSHVYKKKLQGFKNVAIQPNLRNLPPGFHVLKPGQKLPAGAKIVYPIMIQPTGGRNPSFKSVSSPRSATLLRANTNMLDEAPEEAAAASGEGEEAEEAEEAPRSPPPVVMTAQEKIDLANQEHQEARMERRVAGEYRTQAQTLEREGVQLIQSGWKRHQDAEKSLKDALGKVDEADEMITNSNKIKDLANAHRGDTLATQMETIASELSAASEEKAAEAEKLQSEADSYKDSGESEAAAR